MSAVEKIYLPDEYYKQEFPISRLRPLADAPLITPAESPRGFLLNYDITQTLGGVILGNTNWRTDQYHPESTATPEQIAKSRIERMRLAAPALFDNDGPYPGPIVRIKRDTNGEPIRPIERVTLRNREIKPIPPAETLMTRNDKGEVVWIDDSNLEDEETPTVAEYPGKPETYIFDTEGIAMGVFGVIRDIKRGGPTDEYIVPSAIRATARRGDIKLGMNIAVNPDLSLAKNGISVFFEQRDFRVAYHEGHGGNAAAVPIVARALARSALSGSMRVYVPQLYKPASLELVNYDELAATAAA